MRFSSFLFGGFTTMAIINPPERKLEKRTSVQWCGSFFSWLFKNENNFWDYTTCNKNQAIISEMQKLPNIFTLTKCRNVKKEKNTIFSCSNLNQTQTKFLKGLKTVNFSWLSNLLKVRLCQNEFMKSSIFQISNSKIWRISALKFLKLNISRTIWPDFFAYLN